jgi:hypothetical protein
MEVRFDAREVEVMNKLQDHLAIVPQPVGQLPQPLTRARKNSRTSRATNNKVSRKRICGTTCAANLETDLPTIAQLEAELERLDEVKERIE